jgi:ubiquinone/menaquinone biosynthesis C-methylase UbiE
MNMVRGPEGGIARPDSLDKKHYENEVQYFEVPGFLDRHEAMMREYLASFRARLAEFAAKRGPVRVLELGAGMCMMSLLLSREPWIQSMHCADISASRMAVLAGRIAEKVGGTTEKMTFSEADFTDPFTFEDQSFDVILFDSALHHSRNMWMTLRECHRVLSDGGLIIAQREQYLGRLTYAPILRRILHSRQVRDGVTENAYFKEQYNYWLRATGFDSAFVPVSHGRFRFIAPLNGWLHSKWTIIAEKKADAPYLG